MEGQPAAHCGLEGCPVDHASIPHGHVPRVDIPETTLGDWEMGARSSQIAQEIRDSYDGLTEDQRRREAPYLGELAVA